MLSLFLDPCSWENSSPLVRTPELVNKHKWEVFTVFWIRVGIGEWELPGGFKKLEPSWSWVSQQMLSLLGHRKPINPVTVDSRSICAVCWASLGPLQSNSVFPHSLLRMWHFCFWRHLPCALLFSCVRIWHFLLKEGVFSKIGVSGWIVWTSLQSSLCLFCCLGWEQMPSVFHILASLVFQWYGMGSSFLLLEKSPTQLFFLEICGWQWMRCSARSSGYCHFADLRVVGLECGVWLFHSSVLR